MAVNLFLTTALLSITGSTTYVLMKLLLVAGRKRLSQNWQYRSITAISLLFVLPLHKLWALVPVHPSIIAANGNTESIYIPSTSVITAKQLTQIGHINGGFDWGLTVEWIAAVWLLVAASLIFWNIWRLLRYRRLIEQASNDLNGRFQQIALESARLVGVTGEIRLLTSPVVQSPMLIGFFRPTILLPSENLPDSDARFILAHELTHFRRGDLWKKLLINMIQCIHWFNPIVYLLNQDFAYWLETSCDEEIVSFLDYEQRKEYGYLLINYASTSRYVGSKLYVSFTTCRYKLKRRISIMMKSNKNFHSLLGLVLALALVVGCLTTSAFAATVDTDKTSDDLALSFSDGQDNAIKEYKCEEKDTDIVTIDQMTEYTATIDLSTAISMDLGGKARAMKTIAWDVDKGSINIATEACSMEAGQKININVSVSPASSAVWIGIVDPSGTFRYVTAASGSVNHDFSITTRGTYYVCVMNGSSYDVVSVVGFVNY